MRRWGWLICLLAAACSTAKPVPTPTFQNWHQSRTVDALTGKEIVAVWTDAETPYVYSGMDTTEVGKTFTPQLWIRCRDNKIDVYISMGAFIDLGREYGMSYRFSVDYGSHWDAIYGNQGFYEAFYEGGGESLPLSEDGTTVFLTDSSTWMKAFSLSRQLHAAIGEPGPTFDLTGYDEVVKPVLNACKTAISTAISTATPKPTRAPSTQFGYNSADWSNGGDSSEGLVGASTISENSYTISGQPGVRAMLKVRCKDNKLDVYIQTGAFLGFQPQDQTITYRFDEQPAQTHQFPVSRNNGGIDLTGISESMLKTMSTSQRLQVIWAPYILSAQEPVELTFSLNGYNEAVKPVLDACK